MFLGGKRKSEEPYRLENAILELAVAKRAPKIPKETKEKTSIEQWALWLVQEIGESSDKNDRIEIQSYITTYIANKRREQFS